MKIALIEIGGSHDECLYSQVKILKSVENIELSLVYNESLQDSIDYFDLVDHKKPVLIRSGSKRLIDLFKLWKWIKKEGFDKVIFNTAQGKIISRLLLLPFKAKLYGTLHNIRKLAGSGSQKLITKKMERYFVLNQYLIEKINPQAKAAKEFVEFHPIFFPNYPKYGIEKKENEIWICVPGQVENKRRDYPALFESLKNEGCNKNLKFIFLGRCGHQHGDGEYVKSQINALGMEDNFMLWEAFVDVKLFHNMLAVCDYILPLMHKGHPSGDLYVNQISGAFNIAAGYKTPLIMEKAYAGEKFTDYDTVLYDKQNIMQVLNGLCQAPNPVNYKLEKWSFAYQRKQYLKAVDIEISESSN